MAAPPNLAVPKGWKPPPGVGKATTQYQPKQTTRNLVQLPRAPRLFTGIPAPGRTLEQGIHQQIQHARQQAQPTAGERHYEAQNRQNAEGKLRSELGRQLLSEGKINPNLFKPEGRPNLAQAHPAPAPKPGLLDRILKGVGTGVHGLEEGVAKGESLLNVGPIGGRTHVETPGERRAEQGRSAKVLTQVGLARGLGAAGVAAGGAARGLELGAAAKGLESAAIDRGALGAIGGKAAEAPGNLRPLAEAVGARAPTAGSRALRTAGAGAAGYSKLLVTAAPAKAAAESSVPKKNESFPEHLYHSAINTIANLPAGVIESAKHPVKTLEGLGQLYTHPRHAFEENPFGAALAWLAPATAIDRGAGGFIRGVSKGHYLSRERPSLAYEVGAPTAREYQSGAIAQQLQKFPDRLSGRTMKGFEKGKAGASSDALTGRPQVKASGRQEVKAITGGYVKPGQVDLITQGERLGHNLEAMKGRHFLAPHLVSTSDTSGLDAAHNDLRMAFLEGVAKTPESARHDIGERLASLRERQHTLSHEDLALNKAQVKRLENVEQHWGKFSHGDVVDAEHSAGAIAVQERQDWQKLHQEGVGEPNQLNARNLTAVLSHPHLMNRGELRFLEEPGEHPHVPLLKAAESDARKAGAKVDRLNAELKGMRLAPGHKSGIHVRLAEGKELAAQATERKDDLAKKLEVLKFTHQVKPNGDQFPGVYDEAGTRIGPKDVQKLLDEHFNGREMGFVTHKQDKALVRSSNTYGPRTTYPMRTGGNFMAGAYDNSAAALRDHFDRTAYNLAEMRGSRSVAENLVLGRPEGGWYKTQQEAEAAAKARNFTPEGEQLKPHLGQWKAYPVGAHKVADIIGSHPFGHALEQEGHVESAATQQESGIWGITPEKVGNRLDKWGKVEAQVRQSPLREITTPWRQTNLYTSVRWPFGTTQENAIRLAFHRVSPLVTLPYGKYTSLSFGSGSHIPRFLEDKINDPSVGPLQKQAAAFHRAMYGTGNFVGAQLHELMPSLEQMSEKHPWIQKLSESRFNETKVGRNHAVGWRPYRQFIGHALNKMETNAKVAAGGKLALNDAGFFKKFRQLDKEQAAHDYVEKITSNPSESIKAAEKLMDIMGNWNHLTPLTRQAQAEFAPFALWFLNSVKFVFKTMPKDHPYATGLLAAMVTATGAEHKDLKNYLAGDVPLTLPFLGAINLNPVHYSPFDIAHEPEKTGPGMILPQVVEPVSTAEGVDLYTGNKIEGGAGVPRALRTMLEGYVPGARLASQISGKGGKEKPNAIFPWETKPGTDLGYGKAAVKALAPFKFSYQRKPKVSGGEGKGNWGGGGGGFGGGGGSGHW